LTQDRETSSLRWPPEDPSALEGFPIRPLSPNTDLFRVVRRGFGPWWFGSSMKGRFDLPEPDGTCYLAMDEISALLEVIGPDLESGAVSSHFLSDRSLRKLRVPEEQSLSDLTSRQAVRFGITTEIGTVVPYGCPQAWAAKLRMTGSQGVVYWARHDPSHGEAMALFAPQGERKKWKRGREMVISRRLLARLRQECGVEVIDVPRSDELTILGD
jgi:hypothetical protein